MEEWIRTPLQISLDITGSDSVLFFPGQSSQIIISKGANNFQNLFKYYPTRVNVPKHKNCGFQHLAAIQYKHVEF